MIVSVLLLLFLFIMFVSKYKYKRGINTVTIFTFIWFFFAGISSLDITGYRVPSNLVFGYSAAFVLIVDTVLLVFSTRDSVHNDLNINVYESNQSNNGVIIEVLTLVLLTPMLYKSLSILIETHSFVSVRLSYFGGNNFSNAYMDLLFRQFPMGMIQGLIIFDVYKSFEYKEVKLLGLALFNTIIATFVDGGRYSIMLLIYSIIVLWMRDSSILQNFNIFHKFKKEIRRALFAIGIILIVLTINRGQDISKSIFGYFSGSLSFLDYIISNPDQFALNEKMWGYLTFGFILEPIILLLKVIGITDAKIPSYYFNIYCQDFYNVGNGDYVKMFNNNTTVLYYYLRDFGEVGIIIGAVLISTLTVILFNEWVKKNNSLCGMLYVYMCNVLFNSLMTNQLFQSTPLFICVALFLCTRNSIPSVKIRLN